MKNLSTTEKAQKIADTASVKLGSVIAGLTLYYTKKK